MSSAFPAGGPSRMSVNTTSASSRSTMRCAVVDPTNPPPTTVTFFRLILISVIFSFRFQCDLKFFASELLRGGHAFHVFDDRGGECRGADFCCAGHQALQI